MATGTLTRSSNPALSDKAMQRAATDLDSGWAAPGTATRTAPGAAPPESPISTHDTMTMRGVIWAAAVLIVLLVGGAMFGWLQTPQTGFQDELTGEFVNTTTLPVWSIFTMLGATGVAFLTVFKPNFARVTGPLYAVGIGTFLGAISAYYAAEYAGIVLQAVMGTAGVFAVMLFLYGTRIIKVTKRLVIGIIAAGAGIMLSYFVGIIWMLIAGGTPAIFEGGPIGIIFSLVAVSVASFFLLLDFDFIERGVDAGLPKGMEWYAAFGLLTTLVWIYIEMLRLFSKLRS